jgi:transcriptional repressor NrdR
MKCPGCGQDDDRVLDTRSRNHGKSIRRKRLCLRCGKRFYTIEDIEDKTPLVVKRDGRREAYDRNKLIRSIQIACTKRPVSLESIERIADDVESEMDLGYEIPSARIGETVIESLRRIDEVAYVRFASVYRNFRDKDEFLRELNQLGRSEPESGPAPGTG